MSVPPVGAQRDRRPRIDGRHVALLVALRLRLWTGELRRSVPRAVVTLLALLVLVAASGWVCSWLGVTAAELRRAGEASDLAALVRGVHLLALLLPALGALVALRVDDPLEQAPLAALPVAPGSWLTASLLRSLLAPAAVLLSLSAVSVAVGAASGVTSAALGVVAALATVSTGVAVGRLLVLRLAPLLSSRRWSDRLVLVGPLVGAAVFVGLRVLLESGDTSPEPAALFRPAAPVLKVLVFLPSWWSAQVVVGEGFAALWPLLAFPLLWWWLGPALGRAQADLAEATSAAATGAEDAAPAWTLRIPGALGALVAKDRLLLRREPAVRAQVVQVATYACVPVALIVWSVLAAEPAERAEIVERLGRALPHVGLLGPCLVLAQLPLLMNQFGFDGDGAAATLGTSVDRATVVRAKWIAWCSWLAAYDVGAVLLVALGLWLGTPGEPTLPLLVSATVETVAALGLGTALGLLASVELPVRLTPRSRSAGAPDRGRGGALAAVAAGVLVLLGVVAIAPLSAVLHLLLPATDVAGWLRWGGLVGAAGWCVGVVPAALALAARRLRSREEQLLRTLAGR